jgi:hypothetical protein
MHEITNFDIAFMQAAIDEASQAASRGEACAPAP